MVSSLPLSIPQPASALQYDILFREPDDSLPEPLPSVETIEDARINDSYAARSIACVGTSYFVKYGYGVEPLEAENMKFVRQYTNIHVPRVYAVYRRSIREGGQKTYIIMEKIEGESLEKLWDEFDTTQKLSITRQLKESFISLRDLPHHGYFGSLDKTKLRDFLFAADEPMPSIDAPFDTEEALLDGLMDRFLAEDPDRLRHKASYTDLCFHKRSRATTSLFLLMVTCNRRISSLSQMDVLPLSTGQRRDGTQCIGSTQSLFAHIGVGQTIGLHILVFFWTNIPITSPG